MRALHRHPRARWLLAILIAGALGAWYLHNRSPLGYLGTIPPILRRPLTVHGGYLIVERLNQTRSTRTVPGMPGAAPQVVVVMSGTPETTVRPVTGGPERLLGLRLAGYDVAAPAVIDERCLYVRLAASSRALRGGMALPALAAVPLDGGPARILCRGPECAANGLTESGGRLYWTAGYDEHGSPAWLGARRRWALWSVPTTGGTPTRLATFDPYYNSLDPPVVSGGTVFWIGHTWRTGAQRQTPRAQPAPNDLSSILWVVPMVGGAPRKVAAGPGWWHDLRACDDGVSWRVSPAPVRPAFYGPYGRTDYLLPAGSAGAPSLMSERRHYRTADGTLQAYRSCRAGAQEWRGRLYWVGQGVLGGRGAAGPIETSGMFQSAELDGTGRRPVPGPGGAAPVRLTAWGGQTSAVYRDSLYSLVRREDDRSALFRVTGPPGSEHTEEICALPTGKDWSVIGFDSGYCYLLARPPAAYRYSLWDALLAQWFRRSPAAAPATLWRVRLPG